MFGHWGDERLVELKEGTFCFSSSLEVLINELADNYVVNF